MNFIPTLHYITFSAFTEDTELMTRIVQLRNIEGVPRILVPHICLNVTFLEENPQIICCGLVAHRIVGWIGSSQLESDSDLVGWLVDSWLDWGSQLEVSHSQLRSHIDLTPIYIISRLSTFCNYVFFLIFN